MTTAGSPNEVRHRDAFLDTNGLVKLYSSGKRAKLVLSDSIL